MLGQKHVFRIHKLLILFKWISIDKAYYYANELRYKKTYMLIL